MRTPLKKENFRELGSYNRRKYDTRWMITLPSDGLGRKYNKIQILIDSKIVAHESVRLDYHVVEGISKFLNLKIFEAERLGRKIIVNHNILERKLSKFDNHIFSSNGLRFIESIIIEGLEMLDSSDRAGIFLAPDKIQVRHIENVFSSDELSILAYGEEIIRLPMDREQARIQYNRFQLFHKQVTESNDMIYFNLSYLYLLYEGRDPNRFMEMFKLGSRFPLVLH